jgi:striatin 1/3/4
MKTSISVFLIWLLVCSALFMRISANTSWLGQCKHSILAHQDSVTSVSLDAAGLSLVSGGHDCSVRFWDILGSCACVQEIPSHREKAREGVLAVEFHPTLPVMASAGADGVVKLYASS